jgi:PadR family transcriptional regulator, regulatory protein PadR
MLGHLEESTMLAVLELENTNGGAFGLAVFNRLKELGVHVVNGTVYNTLDRLEEKGLLRSEMTEPIPERGGRRKRIYFLEGKGMQVLRESFQKKQFAISNWRLLENV